MSRTNNDLPDPAIDVRGVAQIQRFDAVTEDLGRIEELTRAMFGTSVRVERSDGQVPSLRLAQAATEDFGVQRVTWNVDGRCAVGPLERFLAIRLHRGAYGLDQGEGRAVYTGGDAFLVDPHSPVDAEVIGADLDSVTIERDALETVAAQVAPGHRGLLNYQQAVPVTDPLSAAWSAALDEVAGAMRAGAAAENPLVQAGLLYRLAATACAAFALVPEGRGERPVPGRSVRRALAHIEEHLAEPITVGDIAVAAGVSVRGLHEAFRRTLDTTPHTYLQRARLHAARNDLLKDDGASITAVAARWGFAHSGRFARYYRDEFGETPSRTRDT